MLSAAPSLEPIMLTKPNKPGYNKPPGRTTEYDEPLSEMVRVLFTPGQYRELEERVGRKGLSTWIRAVILGEEAPPVASETPDHGLLNLVQLKFLTAAPCGDFQEALEHAGGFVLSRDVAEFLGATPDDVIVRATGSSMEGAGIFDGQLLLMAPLGAHALPRRGDVSLVQIHRKTGEVEGTIKRWDKSGVPNGTPPRLLDGQDRELKYPKDLVKVEPIAVARGVIGRI